MKSQNHTRMIMNKKLEKGWNQGALGYANV
jgi:hypothetical protein